MKIFAQLPVVFLCTALALAGIKGQAQAIDPNKTARADANRDAEFIDISITDYEDLMFLSQKGVDRATEERVKELAQQMLKDYSETLYAMERLKTAGAGSSKQTASQRLTTGDRPAGAINQKLSSTSKGDFDSVWVANMMTMTQTKLAELTQASETATNPQLKTSIKDALPLVRKHEKQLRTINKELIRAANQKRKEAELERRNR